MPPQSRLWAATLLAGIGCASAAVQAPIAAADSPLGKVTMMLQEMLAKSESLKDEADAQWQQAQSTCQTTTAAKQEEVATLQAQIPIMEANVQQSQLALTQLKQSMAGYETDLDLLTQRKALGAQSRLEQEASWAQDLEAYNLCLAATQRAKIILQTQQPSARPSTAASLAAVHASLAFLGARGRGSPPGQGGAAPGPRLLRAGSVQAHPAAAGAAAALALAQRADYTPDGGGMAKDEHIFDDFQDVTKQTGSYTSQAGGVTGVLDKLIQIVTSYRDDLLRTKEAALAGFKSDEANTDSQASSTRQGIAQAQQDLASTQASLLTQQGELADARKRNDTAATYLASLVATCTQQAADYQEMTELRNGEITALTKAVQFLQSIMKDGAPAQASLLRMHAARDGAGGAGVPKDDFARAVARQKVMGFLRVQATRLGSDSLGSLAERLEGAFASAGAAAGPDQQEAMAKVRTMVEDLVAKLQAEAAQEASHKAWCDAELGRNQATRDGAQAKVTRAAAQAQQLRASIAKVQLQLDKVNATLVQGAVTRPQMVDERAQDQAENNATIEDADASAAAVQAAMDLLQEYYRNATKAAQRKAAAATTSGGAAPQAVQGPQLAGSTGAIAMLEVVRDRYKDVSAKAQKDEQETAANYKQALQDLDVMLAAAGRDKENMLVELQSYQKGLEDTQNDLNASTQVLSDAQNAYEQLKPPCVTGETYEERKAKRDEEIASLQEAYNMLEEYTTQMGLASLVQRRARQLGPPAARRPAAPPARAAAPLPPAPPPPVPSRGPAAGRRATNGTAGGPRALRRGMAKAVALAAKAETAQDPQVMQTVTDLLLEIQAEVSADLLSDTQVYNDTMAWCQNSTAASQASIAAADARDRELVTIIETSAQMKAQLEIEIERLQEELARETQSLARQSAFRSDERDKFDQGERELLASIYALSHAVDVLQKTYNRSDSRNFTAEEAAIQATKNQSSLLVLAGELKEVLGALPASEAGVLGTIDGAALQAFLAHPQDLLLSVGARLSPSAALAQTARGSKKTVRDAPVDGRVIFGILQQLLDTFKADLQASRDRESADNSTFVSLQETKRTQIQAMRDSLQNKQEQLANENIVNARAKEDLLYVRENRQAEMQLLLSVRSQCTEAQGEFQLRNTSRLSELASLSEAISLLSPDTAVTGTNLVPATAALGLERRKVRVSQPPLPHPPAPVPLPAAVPQEQQVLVAAPKLPPPKPESVVDDFIRTHRPAPAAHVAPHRIALTDGQLLRQRAALSAALRAARVPLPVVRHPPAARPLPMAVSALAAASAPAAPRRPPAPRLSALALRRAGGRGAGRGTTALAGGQANVPAILASSLDQVGVMVDKVETALVSEKQLEVQLQQTCISEKQQADMQLARRQHDLASCDADIVRLTSMLAISNSTLADLLQQVDSINGSLVLAQVGRSEEYLSFKNSTEEQVAMQAKLRAGMQALKKHYNSQKAVAAALVQLGQTPANATSATAQRANATAGVRDAYARAATAPKPQFARPLQSHEGGKGIIAILEMLVEQSEGLVEEIVRAEQRARDAYGTNVQETRRALEGKDQEIVTIQATMANGALELQQKTDLDKTLQAEILEIQAFLAIVAKKCDYLVQNFDQSQAARQAQIDSVRQAKQVILGALEAT